MKKIAQHFPFLSKVILAIVLGFGAIVLSGMIYKAVPIHTYFPFVGELLLLVVTWILYRTDGQNLSSIGLNLSGKNIVYLVIGLLVGVVAFFCVSWLRTLYTGEVWHLASDINLTALAKSLYYILPTVVVQELMFRGYLFTKTISRYNVVIANTVFSLAFMLVHVLDRDVLQNTGQIIFLAVCIPIGHLWFATSLLRSKTLLFPIGLHWGNNWAVTHLAGNSDNKLTLFYLTNQKVFTTWPPFIISLLIFNVFFLAVILITWKAKWPKFEKTNL